MCEDAEEVAYRCLPRNLSYEGNIYHCKYYSTKVVSKKLRKKYQDTLPTTLHGTLDTSVTSMSDNHGAPKFNVRPDSEPHTSAHEVLSPKIPVAVTVSSAVDGRIRPTDNHTIVSSVENGNDHIDARLSLDQLEVTSKNTKSKSLVLSSLSNKGKSSETATSNVHAEKLQPADGNASTTNSDVTSSSKISTCALQKHTGTEHNALSDNIDSTSSYAASVYGQSDIHTSSDGSSNMSTYSEADSKESLERLLRATNIGVPDAVTKHRHKIGILRIPACEDQSDETIESPDLQFLSVPGQELDVDEESEFGYLSHKKFQRSTSLKTNKTPPGTPHRKKVVRFADAMGLDLASVRHIMDQASPPSIPISAMKDLDSDPALALTLGEARYLSPLFAQPSAAPDFYTRVQGAKVLLENCIVNNRDMTITGVVRVANLAMHKRVVIRRTVNNWLTSEDSNASYVLNSNDGPTDRFSFCISVPHYFGAGSRIEFAVMYTTMGQTYWDNNNGTNYVVECYARATSPRLSEDRGWLHFM